MVLKLVVHHAPVAMCPFSFAVVSRCISVSLLKVIVQFDAFVSPTACGFQWIRFCSGLRETSPSMLIISVVEAVWFCCDVCFDRVWLLLEKDVLDRIRVGRLTSIISSVM